jgi:hypothetical protein
MRHMEGSEQYPPIVQRALKDGHVTDLGQLTDAEAEALKAAVKNGVLKKGKGGGYPVPKTVYAHPEFNIEGHHAAELAKLHRAAAMDSVVRVMKENDPRRS